jgi:hypothetical protein
LRRSWRWLVEVEVGSHMKLQLEVPSRYLLHMKPHSKLQLHVTVKARAR